MLFQCLQLARNCNSHNIIYSEAKRIFRPSAADNKLRRTVGRHQTYADPRAISTLQVQASALTLEKNRNYCVRPNTKSIRGEILGSRPRSLSTVASRRGLVIISGHNRPIPIEGRRFHHPPRALCDEERPADDRSRDRNVGTGVDNDERRRHDGWLGSKSV